jgi:citrate lyase gamma subunit
MTAREIAEEIRKNLKRHGITSRQVSVRAKTYLSCILDNLKSYYAADEYGLREVLAILAYQYGFDFTKVSV